MTSLRPWVLIVPLACLAAACTPKDLQVVSAGPPMVNCTLPNCEAPDIVYLKDGKPQSVRAVGAPIAIVAFVRTGGCDSHWIDPRLVPLAIQFRNLPVSVVQVSLPWGPGRGGAMAAGAPADSDVAGNKPVSQAQALMPAGDYCCDGTRFNERLAAEVLSMVPLCDTGELALNAYGRPVPDWAYLVDEQNHVVDAAPLDDMEELAWRAHVMADDLRGRWTPPKDKRLQKLCCLAVVWCAPWEMRSQYTARTPGGCPLGLP